MYYDDYFSNFSTVNQMNFLEILLLLLILFFIYLFFNEKLSHKIYNLILPYPIASLLLVPVTVFVIQLSSEIINIIDYITNTPQNDSNENAFGLNMQPPRVKQTG